mmetsp:Transcript_87627/g.283692  ORF Transcript_87627/g.283692 Transcript_87627/m.283692 type:complete len:211 (+) Transcript_87627:638-1270(+)
MRTRPRNSTKLTFASSASVGSSSFSHSGSGLGGSSSGSQATRDASGTASSRLPGSEGAFALSAASAFFCSRQRATMSTRVSGRGLLLASMQPEVSSKLITSVGLSTPCSSVSNFVKSSCSSRRSGRNSSKSSSERSYFAARLRSRSRRRAVRSSCAWCTRDSKSSNWGSTLPSGKLPRRLDLARLARATEAAASAKPSKSCSACRHSASV